ncbi:hypothetical protein [Phenylobacterium sp.]|uniref:hypothetical protein n=1 Tax=Phenylobacterium sp. TaxID=1871053 RepID=UPI0027351562|nr:hypothetical protein [Phenylobacterium sp.]MDP3853131.1 hypothetical protein [Phenylobacterium sp.]
MPDRNPPDPAPPQPDPGFAPVLSFGADGQVSWLSLDETARFWAAVDGVDLDEVCGR